MIDLAKLNWDSILRWHRPCATLYHNSVKDAQGFRLPIEAVPVAKVRVTMYLDGEISPSNPKYEELKTKLDEAEQTFTHAMQLENAGDFPLTQTEANIGVVTEFVPRGDPKT